LAAAAVEEKVLQLKITPPIQKVPIGSDVQLKCNSNNDIGWKFEDISITTEDNYKIYAENDNSILFINGIKPTQFGVYYCLKTSEADDVSTSAAVLEDDNDQG